MDSDKLDDAVDRANEVLEGLLEDACGWFVSKIEAARERRENAEEEKEE